MPFLSWCQLNSVFCLCFVQWAMLVYLLSTNNDEQRPETRAVLPLVEQRFGFQSSSFSTSGNSHNNCSCPPNRDSSPARQDDWEGVAVGLMLRRPKWFYRRYHIMINTVLAVIPDTWSIQLFVHEKWFQEELLSFHQGLKRSLHNNNNRIQIFILPSELENKKPIQLLKERWVWQHVAGERVLMFHGDGTLCANSIVTFQDFNHLAYVGVPWQRFEAKGGAGTEFSLRSRSAMLAALDYKTPQQHEREDLYFVSTLLEMNQKQHTNYSIATRQETEMFAGTNDLVVDNTLRKDLTDSSWGPLVVAGIQGHLTDPVREYIIGKCPEIKSIYPSLHNPSCFGAKPNLTTCAVSIGLRNPTLN